MGVSPIPARPLRMYITLRKEYIEMKILSAILVIVSIAAFLFVSGCERNSGNPEAPLRSGAAPQRVLQSAASTPLVSVYGVWHAGNDYCTWGTVRIMTEFDSKNHWLIDRGDGSGLP